MPISRASVEETSLSVSGMAVSGSKAVCSVELFLYFHDKSKHVIMPCVSWLKIRVFLTVHIVY